MKHYAHLGTGNYNPRTARFYTDLSYFTARVGITGDVAQLFNSSTGFGRTPTFRHLLVAPYNLHRRIGELIARESRNAAAGKPARIIAKMNALVDRATIEALYSASQAGVQIDLIVRGVCCLVPGVKGLSENIRVRSLVGRFLEHARAIYFENAGAEPLTLAGQRRLDAAQFLPAHRGHLSHPRPGTAPLDGPSSSTSSRTAPTPTSSAPTAPIAPPIGSATPAPFPCRTTSWPAPTTAPRVDVHKARRGNPSLDRPLGRHPPLPKHPNRSGCAATQRPHRRRAPRPAPSANPRAARAECPEASASPAPAVPATVAGGTRTEACHSRLTGRRAGADRLRESE